MSRLLWAALLAGGAAVSISAPGQAQQDLAEPLAGPTVQIKEPSSGAEVQTGTTMRVEVRITGERTIELAQLFWRKTGNYLDCPGDGRAWRCTRSGNTYRWELDLGSEEGERRFFVRASDTGGTTMTADRWVRAVHRPTGQTLSLVEPRLGTVLRPGLQVNLVVATAGGQPLRSVTVRSSSGQVAYNLVPGPSATWGIGATVVPPATRDEVFTLEAVTEQGRRISAGPYRFRVERETPTPAPTEGEMPIFRHRNTPLSDDRADQIMDNFRLILATDDDDAGYDSECNTDPPLAREGDVLTFNIGDGNVNTQSELSQILSQGGSSIYLVNEGNFCAGKFKTTYLGCSSNDNPMMVEAMSTVAASGILWAHEFGHSSGSLHSSANGYVDNLMSSGHRLDKRRVTDRQCRRFQAQVRQMAGSAEEEAEEELPTDDNRPADAVSLKEFIRLTFFDEFPFREAARYGREAVPGLLRELEAPSADVDLTTVIATLGAIGDPAAFPPLVRFFESGSGRLSPEAYRAKTTALFVLGEILARASNPAIRDYLLDGTDPTVWSVKVQWQLPYEAPEGTRDRQLAIIAIEALGVAGEEDGFAAKGLLTPAAPETEATREMAEVVEHAVATSEIVRRIGIEAYYENNQ
jgi:hypothetical protein